MKKLIVLFYSFFLSFCLSATVYNIGSHEIHFDNGIYYKIYLNDTFRIDTSTIMIKYYSGTDGSVVSTVENNNSLVLKHQFIIDFKSYNFHNAIDFISMCTNLSNEPAIEVLELNCEVKYYCDPMTPDDYDYGDQWYLDRIEVPYAWSISTGIPEVIVAILDSGFDWEHNDLGPGNDSYDNIYLINDEDDWSSWNDPSSGNLTDDDGNGYIDDWKGWGATGNDTRNYDLQYLLGQFPNDPQTAYTIWRHGTYISGIIGAKTNNGEHISGIAGGWNDNGISMLLYKNGYIDHPPGTFKDEVIEGIEYAISENVNVIQMAFGCEDGLDIEAALDFAYNNGVFLVAAAGNGGGDISFPANHDKVFAVGATDYNDLVTNYSNYGDELNLCAPGENILGLQPGNSIVALEGRTSAASAIVSGTIGLMLSTNPSLTLSQIEEILHESADKVHPDEYDYDENGWCDEIGHGRLNAYKAVCMAWEYIDVGEEITSNTTWSSDQTFINPVVVKNGAKLTITSEIQFGPEAALIVEQGAELELNGGLLTNMKCCGYDDLLWPGVEVWGSSTKSQYIDPSDGIQWQGKLILTNGATIENAEYGVLLSARDDSPDGFDDNKNGGIISITNSGEPTEPGAIFLNNKKAVVFRIYNNFNPVNPSVPMNNISKLENCYFNINTDYLGEAWWYSHIYAFGVNGVRIAGCTFDNNKTTVPMGHGINAWGAGFRVEALCNSTSSPCPPAYLDKCTFTNFAKGINNNSSGTKTIYVSDADFFNNSYGVILDAVNNATIIFCNFEIGYNYNEKDECDDLGISRGIDISNSFGFTIEENNFTKAQGIPAGEYMGIRINESHTRYDLIYRNNLNDLDFGNYAEGLNRNNPNDDRDGLEYQCNINSGNDIDFIVTGPVNTYPQIRTFQGLISKAAGNKFSSGATMHFQNDGTQVIDYFYWNTTGEVPIYYTPFYVQPILASSSNGCPPNYGGTGGDDRGMVLSDEERQDLELNFADALADFNNVKTLYENLKDGGNTEALQTDIELSWPQDMWELRAELLGHSPHLSKEVLMTAADKTDVLPDAVLFEILSANPDELRKDDLIQYLENKENPLPEYMVSILRDLAAGITYKTVLQQQMADYSAKKTQAAYKIVRSILLDDEMDHIDLRNWLDNIGGIRADEMIIQSFIAEGNYTDAISLMSLLPSLYNLEGNTLASYQDYSAMINMLKSVDDDSRNITEFTESEKSVVIDIAENGYGNGKDMARGILNFAYGYNYCDCPQPLNTAGTKSATANKADYQKAFGAKVNVEPNPVGEWAVFNYELPGDATEGVIKITDVSGRVIDEIIVYGPVGQKVWDTRNIKNGSYFYSITVNGINTGGKIIVNK